MKSEQNTTQETLHSLLSGANPLAQKYAGKQVFVIGNEVVLLKGGKRGIADFKRLKTKHGKPPVLIFVPKPGSSYILISI